MPQKQNKTEGSMERQRPFLYPLSLIGGCNNIRLFEWNKKGCKVGLILKKLYYLTMFISSLWECLHNEKPYLGLVCFGVVVKVWAILAVELILQLVLPLVSRWWLPVQQCTTYGFTWHHELWSCKEVILHVWHHGPLSSPTSSIHTGHTRTQTVPSTSWRPMLQINWNKFILNLPSCSRYCVDYLPQ